MCASAVAFVSCVSGLLIAAPREARGEPQDPVISDGRAASRAIQANDPVTLALLLDRGIVSPDGYTDRGRRLSFLPLAAITGNANLPVLKVLVDHGARELSSHPGSYPTCDPYEDALDLIGTLLISRRQYPNRDYAGIVTLLVDSGILEVTANSRTYGRALIDTQGPRPQPAKRCQNWKPATFRLFAEGSIDIGELLIRRGTDIHSTDSRGNTVAHAVAIYSSEARIIGISDAAKVILHYSPDLTLRNRRGMRPIDFTRLTQPGDGTRPGMCGNGASKAQQEVEELYLKAGSPPAQTFQRCTGSRNFFCIPCD